jgi:hypothetical protein
MYTYIHKGHDRARYTIDTEIYEVKDYVDARYVSTCEAVLRILAITMFHRSHSITLLAVHLPLQKTIRFGETDGQINSSLQGRRR